MKRNPLNLAELSCNFYILANIISQRKAIREYNSQKIPAELVEKVIKIAWDRKSTRLNSSH